MEHPLLPSITPEAVTVALKGLNLKFAPGKDVKWLSLVLGRVLALTVPPHGDAPELASQDYTKNELEQLSKAVAKAGQRLEALSAAADCRLWDHAWGQQSDSGQIGEPLEYSRYRASVDELGWLADFLQGAATTSPRQSGPWRQSAAKRLRVERAKYLAAVYETAFGLPVTSNQFPNDKTVTVPTSFMQFVSRVVELAFGALENTNLPEVAQEACRIHRIAPAEFAPGLISGV